MQTFKFKIADGHHIGKHRFGHNSAMIRFDFREVL